MDGCGAWRSLVYIVKSVYRILDDACNCSKRTDITDLFRQLWGLKVPSKVKIFIWRACIGSLPTNYQLSVKRVNISPGCPVCLRATETIFYCLVFCSFAKSCVGLGCLEQDKILKSLALCVGCIICFKIYIW